MLCMFPELAQLCSQLIILKIDSVKKSDSVVVAWFINLYIFVKSVKYDLLF